MATECKQRYRGNSLILIPVAALTVLSAGGSVLSHLRDSQDFKTQRFLKLFEEELHVISEKGKKPPFSEFHDLASLRKRESDLKTAIDSRLQANRKSSVEILTLAGDSGLTLPPLPADGLEGNHEQWIESIRELLASRETALAETRKRDSLRLSQILTPLVESSLAMDSPASEPKILGVTHQFSGDSIRIDWNVSGDAIGEALLFDDSDAVTKEAATSDGNKRHVYFPNLKPETNFRFEIAETFASGDIVMHRARFTSPPIEPVIISSIRVSEITHNSARIQWTTNRNTSTIIRYGVNKECGASNQNANEFGTEHLTLLEGLKANTRYYYFIPSSSAPFAPSKVESFFLTKPVETPNMPDSVTDVRATSNSMTPNAMVAQPASGSLESDSFASILRATSRSLPPANFTNSIGMEMVWIPIENESVSVYLNKGFFVSKTEITRAQYERIRAFILSMPDSSEDIQLPEDSSPIASDPRLPVQNVTWRNAIIAGSFLTRLEKNKEMIPKNYSYVLPSFQEWQWFSNGASAANAVTEFNSFKEPQPVGSANDENRFGLKDLLGNVSEWCRDEFTEDLNPTDFVPEIPRLFMEKPNSKAFTGGSYLISYRDSDLLNPLIAGGAAPEEGVDMSDKGFRLVLRAAPEGILTE